MKVMTDFYFFLLQESDNIWWDGFATEFFEDDATLTLTFCLEDGPKRYSASECLFRFLFGFWRILGQIHIDWSILCYRILKTMLTPD